MLNILPTYIKIRLMDTNTSIPLFILHRRKLDAILLQKRIDAQFPD